MQLSQQYYGAVGLPGRFFCPKLGATGVFWKTGLAFQVSERRFEGQIR
jgi:hypothetical protein